MAKHSDKIRPNTRITLRTDSKIVAVRYFHREGDGLRFEELGEDKLEDFVASLNSLELETGGIVDYTGTGYGIEMELADGTYLIYDGTCLSWHSNKLVDKVPTIEDLIDKKDDFVYVMNCEFWDVMKEYFPSIEEHGDKVYSHK